MFTPYNPCDDCKQTKEMCTKCAYKALQINYKRAVLRIVKLSDELGNPIAILI